MSTFVCRAEEGMPLGPDGRELVSHGSTAFPIACYEISVHATRIMPHWHDDLEALTVREGACVVHLGSERRTLYAGQALFVNAGALHAMSPLEGSSGGRFSSVVFSPRLVAGGLESVFWEKYVGPLTRERSLGGIPLDGSEPWHEDAAQRILAAWDACDEEKPGFEFAVRTALSDLLVQISLRLGTRPALRTPSEVRSEERVKAMMQYVHENYAQHLTLETICHHAALSPSECLRCFRSTIGTTPMHYVREYRLTQAAALLRDTDLPAREIAARCGFSDAGYFSKSFRAWSGASPSDYRKQQRRGGAF